MADTSKEHVAFQADVIKALGHPLRIEIVEYLKGQQRSVSEIIEHFSADPSNVSRHLAILKRAGILGSTKNAFRNSSSALPTAFAQGSGRLMILTVLRIGCRLAC